MHYAINDFPLRLIGLDTLVEGEDDGLLCDARMHWLAKTLQKIGISHLLFLCIILQQLLEQRSSIRLFIKPH